MEIALDWRPVTMRHPEANVRGVVYAIVPQPVNGLAYIGRAVKSTVKDRWDARDKRDRIRAPLRAVGYRTSKVLVARPKAQEGRRITRAVLEDIEKALIFHLQPTYNALEKAHPNYRRSLTIHNFGCWTFAERIDATLT